MKRWRVRVTGAVLITDDRLVPDDGHYAWERTIDALTASTAVIAAVQFFERHVLKPDGADLGDLLTMAVTVVPA